MENSEEFALPSGARLRVTPAPFADANRLKNEVLKALKGVDVAAFKDLKMSPADLKAGKGLEALGRVLDGVLSAASSEEMEAAMFACAVRAVYLPAGEEAGTKVSRALFDEPKLAEATRQDYFVMAARVIEVNCKPFFKALFSGSKAPAAKGPGVPA